MAAAVKVLNSWPSMFGMRVIIALKEKDVQYDYQEEDLSNKSELLLNSNPVHKKIPVLLHHGKPVCESLIIVEYIDEAWKGTRSSFLPETPYERACARFWADFVDKKSYDGISRLLRGTDMEAREQGKKELAECFIAMDGALRDVFRGGQPFFGGVSIGFVDIAAAHLACWLPVLETVCGFKTPDAQKCPHLHLWMKRIVEHASVKKAMLLCPPDKIAELVRQRFPRAS